RLRGFAALSVRDDTSRRLVTATTGRVPAMVLDPVLQFPPRIAPAPDQPPYVLVHGHHLSDWFADRVRTAARRRGLRLVSVGCCNGWADEQRLEAGPEEFAALIAGAAAVATTYFHGCVFALVTGRPLACAPSDYRWNKLRDLTALPGAERHLTFEDRPEAEVAALLAAPIDPRHSQAHPRVARAVRRMARQGAGMSRPVSPGQILRSGLCIGCGVCAERKQGVTMVWDRYGQLKPDGPPVWRDTPDARFSALCPFSPQAVNEDALAAARFAAAPAMDGGIGRHIGCYVRAAAEPPFRAQGSSGGMVSWVAVELLRRGHVDDILHVHPGSPSSAIASRGQRTIRWRGRNPAITPSIWPGCWIRSAPRPAAMPWWGFPASSRRCIWPARRMPSWPGASPICRACSAAI
ncbi:MAG TPA: polysaccharide pyruvyl transferase family protein, partial [Paracoccus sp. (in: a-proteobacteria)]|nr:polysaccharide pyruvyl transferase family protein [Paracoccus sp. (in: a-proteobacteria)]